MGAEVAFGGVEGEFFVDRSCLSAFSSRPDGPELNRVFIISLFSGVKFFQISSSRDARMCVFTLLIFPKIMPLHVPLKTFPNGSMWTPFAPRKLDLQFLFAKLSAGFVRHCFGELACGSAIEAAGEFFICLYICFHTSGGGYVFHIYCTIEIFFPSNLYSLGS